MKTSDPSTSVVVRGSDDVNYQKVIVVLDALPQAEITNVGLATDGIGPAVRRRLRRNKSIVASLIVAGLSVLR